MAKYKVTFKTSVTKDLRGIPSHDVKRILQRIDMLGWQSSIALREGLESTYRWLREHETQARR